MILVDISGANAVVRKQDLLTCGMVGAQVRFRFDEQWNGLIKTAVFRAGEITIDTVLSGTTARIPHEVLSVAGIPLQIGVYGLSEDGALVIPTVWAKTNPVRPGADPSGDPGTEPSLPIWAQVRAQAESNAQTLGEMGETLTQLTEKVTAPVRNVTVLLAAGKWEGTGSLYAQQVEIPEVTANSQVNLTPSVSQMAAFCEKGCCFLTENEEGTVTVYLLGERPREDYTVAASIVEVRL